jgi:hypothetical protein
MDWPTASVVIVGMLCWLADRVTPDVRAPKDEPNERTEAIGFHVGQGPDHDEDA